MAARRLALLALTLSACRANGGVAPRTVEPIEFSERETSGNRLIVVRYPTGFLKVVREDAVFLFGPMGGSVRFDVESRPTSEDPNQLASAMPCPEPQTGIVTDRTQKTASCFGGLPGLERSCLFTPNGEPNNQHFSWECLFVKNHHRFSFGYSVPTANRAEMAPLLQSVIAAGEAN